MKTTTEMIAVMTAFNEGKKIVVRNKVLDKHWFETASPLWDWNNYDYEVIKEPSYRPYKDAEECFKDVIKHGGWVKSRLTGFYCQINRVDRLGVAYVNNGYETFEDLTLCKNVWADDGTPCGVKEE